jgi:hypothetical protein
VRVALQQYRRNPLQLMLDARPCLSGAELGHTLHEQRLHTGEDMRPDAVVLPMVEGPHVDPMLEPTEALFDPKESLVLEGDSSALRLVSLVTRRHLPASFASLAITPRSSTGRPPRPSFR